jgi:hypothetical protein
MPRTFFNITNHPSAQWSAAQRGAALALAEGIVDRPFPAVPVEADEAWLRAGASEVASDIRPGDIACVQGECVMTLLIVRELQSRGVACVATANVRHSVEAAQPDGTTRKTSLFRFERFRQYPDSTSGATPVASL